MIEPRFSATIRCHQRKVSPLTTPPGFPPRVPRPMLWDGSLISLIIKKSRLPTLNEYLSQVPLIGNGRLVGSTLEKAVCSPVGSIHLRHHHACASSKPLRS